MSIISFKKFLKREKDSESNKQESLSCGASEITLIPLDTCGREKKKLKDVKPKLVNWT
jgi:hypothetical protein